MKSRPKSIMAFVLFFCFGTIMSGLSLCSLLQPNGPLEPMWRINPQGREAFALMGGWGLLLLGVICLLCLTTAIGLWHKQQWAYHLARAIFVANLIGDITNIIVTGELRTLVGIPIVIAILLFMGTPQIRHYFGLES